MPIQWTINPEKSWPDGADGVSVAPSGTANVYGSWVSIVDPTATAAVLSGVVLRTTSNANLFMEIQIGVAPSGSAADSESPIATIPLTQFGQAFTTDFTTPQCCFVIPVDLIPANSRVSARIRVSTTSTTAYLVSASYYEKPIVGNLLVSAQPIKSMGMPVLVTASGSTWTYGSWATLLDPTATEQVIDGVMLFAGGNTQIEAQFGVGASPSAVALVRQHGAGSYGAFGYHPQMIPLDVIGSSVKVSGRARSNNAAQQVYMSYTYREKPL
jgi:hypothetical protein